MSDQTKDKGITWLVVGIHILIAVMLGMIFSAISGHLVISMVTGIVIWTLVLFKTPVFNWFFFNVKPNWAIIAGNQLKYDVIPPALDDRTKFDKFPLVSMREVSSGIRGKLPWEVAFESIDLQSEFVIGRDEPLQCYTSDDIPLQIAWQVILTPLRGCLVNMTRKGEDASTNYFRGQFTQAIIKWVKSQKEAKVFELLDQLKEEFENVFSGPDKVHPKEEEYGLFTNTPQIITVNRSARYQSAAEGQKIGEKIGSIAGSIYLQFPEDDKPDPNMVLATAASAAGNEISGLLLIPGITGDKTAGALMAAAAKTGVQATGGKNKKGTP